jgi:hypothetical protein
VGQHDGVREFGVRDERVHGRMYSGIDAVLGELGISDLQREWALERAGELHEPGLCGHGLHGRVLARSEAVQRSHPADVLVDRAMARRGGVPERV